MNSGQTGAGANDDQEIVAAISVGNITEPALAMFRRVVTAVVRGRPRPTGAPGAWSDAEVDDFVFDVIDRIGTGRLVIAAQKARDDDAFAVYFKTVAVNMANSAARQSPSGRVKRRIRDVLGDDDGFVKADGAWQLAGDDIGPELWNDGTGPLLDVAWTVPTTAVQWSEKAERAAPFALRADVAAVCRAVLDVAGRLPETALGEVVAARFNVPFTPRYSDPRGDPPGAAADDYGDGFDLSDAAGAAGWMFTQLDEDEKTFIVLTREGKTPEEAGDAMGFGRSKTYLLRSRTVKKMKMLVDQVGGDPDGAAVGYLIDLCVGRSQYLGHFPGHDGGNP